MDEINHVKPTRASRELIVAAYEAFFNRKPESEGVIVDKLDRNLSIKEILRSFINSGEFSYKSSDLNSQIDRGYRASANKVDVNVSPAQFAALFEGVRSQWMLLGDTEPFWSVLSDDQFLKENFESVKDRFYESGKHSEALIDIFCKRNNVDLATGSCLELGCGVGRITRFLAEKFDSVVGVDISEGNLAICKTHLSELNVQNVDLILLREIDQLSSVAGFDFFYSVIVLQHNPPPIIAHLLRTILSRLNPGGAFLFQVPTHIPGYAFDVDSSLQKFKVKERGFEMHSLPMRYVLDIATETGCTMKEVIMDTWAGCYGSHTFFGVKNV